MKSRIYSVLRKSDDEQGGAPSGAPQQQPTNTIDLAAENQQLKELLQQQRVGEALIAEKMAAGLTRDQAVASVEHQRAFDERSGQLSAQRKATRQARR